MTENAVSTTPGSRLSALARKLWFPFFLLLLTILTYGLLTYRQGFYLDDWYIILFKEKLGNQGFMLYFSQDRPFLSYPYVLLMAVFGESAVNWAIFALVMRWVTTCTFWHLLNKLIPDQKKLWIWATVLFAVYPGFRFHWFAIMYAFGYIFLTFYLLSFFAMAKALDHTSKPWLYGLWTLLGLLFLLIGIVPQEYFFGMELFRPVLLYILVWRAAPDRQKNNLAQGFPALAALLCRVYRLHRLPHPAQQRLRLSGRSFGSAFCRPTAHLAWAGKTSGDFSLRRAGVLLVESFQAGGTKPLLARRDSAACGHRFRAGAPAGGAFPP